jgi:hypothetical protein
MGRTRRSLLSASLALAVLVAVPVFAASAQARGNPRATGGGTTEEFGERSTFTFNAVQTPKGVAGHMLYNVRAADLVIHMDLDCLNITGNSAKLSGVVTSIQGDPPDFLFVGQEGVFTVTDNGQGRQAPPDLISETCFSKLGHRAPRHSHQIPTCRSRATFR